MLTCLAVYRYPVASFQEYWFWLKVDDCRDLKIFLYIFENKYLCGANSKKTFNGAI